LPDNLLVIIEKLVRFFTSHLSNELCLSQNNTWSNSFSLSGN